jgi:hypothetical protein
LLANLDRKFFDGTSDETDFAVTSLEIINFHTKSIESAGANVVDHKTMRHSGATAFDFEILWRPESKDTALLPSAQSQVEKRFNTVEWLALKSKPSDLVLKCPWENRVFRVSHSVTDRKLHFVWLTDG